MLCAQLQALQTMIATAEHSRIGITGASAIAAVDRMRLHGSNRLGELGQSY
jgi:hypothetical protein